MTEQIDRIAESFREFIGEYLYDSKHTDIIEALQIIKTNFLAKSVRPVAASNTTEFHEFGIDSGCLWIGDIGYIIGNPKKYGNDQAWSKVCNQLRGTKLPGMIENGIMFSPGRDGGYTIQVTKDKDGRVIKLEMNF